MFAHSHLVAAYLCSLLPNTGCKYALHLTQSINFEMPKAKTDSGRKFFWVGAPNCQNKLPASVKIHSHVISFSGNVKLSLQRKKKFQNKVKETNFSNFQMPGLPVLCLCMAVMIMQMLVPRFLLILEYLQFIS